MKEKNKPEVTQRHSDVDARAAVSKSQDEFKLVACLQKINNNNSQRACCCEHTFIGADHLTFKKKKMSSAPSTGEVICLLIREEQEAGIT